ncbi:MAG: type II toxin-antitoxin system RelE/ParE family toxin [Patescibacteria group bacterium]
MEETSWKIYYHSKVTSADLSRIDRKWLIGIEQAIRERLATNPISFGKPLRYSLKGVRSLRVGDYRVLYILNQRTIYIGAIKHRSVAYDSRVEKRFG